MLWFHRMPFRALIVSVVNPRRVRQKNWIGSAIRTWLRSINEMEMFNFEMCFTACVHWSFVM